MAKGTLNNTVTSQLKVSHKIEQIITGLEENKMSLVAIQEHWLKSTSEINFEKHGTWTLAHTNSPHNCHGVGIFYQKHIASLVTSLSY